MSNLEQALQLNLFEEMEMISTELDEVFIHSEKYEKQINRLFDKMRGDKYHRFTKKATTIILIAAILFALVVAGFAATVGRDFVIKTFSDHFEYSINDNNNVTAVNTVQIGYIPDGFVLENESGRKGQFKHLRFVNGEECFDINKSLITSTINFDTYDMEEPVKTNGIELVPFSKEEHEIRGYIWNKNDCIYYIQGNVSKDELLKIALSID